MNTNYGTTKTEISIRPPSLFTPLLPSPPKVNTYIYTYAIIEIKANNYADINTAMKDVSTFVGRSVINPICFLTLYGTICHLFGIKYK